MKTKKIRWEKKYKKKTAGKKWWSDHWLNKPQQSARLNCLKGKQKISRQLGATYGQTCMQTRTGKNCATMKSEITTIFYKH